jgi:hypothetical protein
VDAGKRGQELLPLRVNLPRHELFSRLKERVNVTISTPKRRKNLPSICTNFKTGANPQQKRCPSTSSAENPLHFQHPNILKLQIRTIIWRMRRWLVSLSIMPVGRRKVKFRVELEVKLKKISKN